MALFNRTSSTGSTSSAGGGALVDDTFDAPTQAVEDISGDYVIDSAHSSIGFSARHAMVTKVRGRFEELEGTAHVDVATPGNSTVRLALKTASINTGQAQRDAHLRSGEFFDIENHPEITFVSTAVEADGDQWAITGDLTINGVSKPVTVEFEQTGSARDPFGNLRVGFEGDITIDRTDWGLSFNAALETGGVLVSEKVKLEFDISAIQQAA